MGILDDYFNGADAASAPVVPTQSSGIINQYMNDDRTASGLKKVYITPAPPISDLPKEQSDAINAASSAKPVYTGGPVTPSITEIPVNAFNAGLDAAKAGVSQMGQGAGQVLSNQPATGLGNVASGALSILTSPLYAAQQVVGDVTGSKDIADRAGLVLGAIPVAKAGQVVKAAIPANKAFKTLVDMIGPENVGNVAKEMRADPRLAPADLSPAVKSATQKLFTIEGDAAKNHVSNFVNDRVNTAKAAVETAMDSSLGKTVDPVEKLKTLSDNIKKVGATEINPVLKATKPVDLTPVVEHIDNILKPGAMSVISNPENLLPYDKVHKLMQSYRDVMTNDKTVLTNPDVLNKLQSGMRRNAEGLMKSIDPEAKAMGYALHQLRQKVIDAVGKAGPQTVDKEGNAVSAYRAGLNKYRDENHIADAFEEGHDSIISNSKKLLDRPEFFKKKVGEYTAEEKEAAKEGARIAIDTQINGFKSAARRGTDVGQIEFNKERISALFGKEEAARLFKKLDNERKIAETNTHLIQNSQTAMRSAADSRVSLPTKTDVRNNALGIGAAEGVNMLTSGVPGVGTALYTGAKLAAWGKDKIATALAKEHNAQLAKIALPVQGPDREELIRSLEAVANKPPRSLLRKTNSLARLVGP
jgi:hypothetical protein